MTSLSRKRGRPHKPYRTSRGQLIDGLRCRSPGRWVIVATGEEFRESDERLAILRFRRTVLQIQAAAADLPLVIDSGDVAADPDTAGAVEAVLRHELNPGRHVAADGIHTLNIPESPSDPVQLFHSIPESLLWGYVRQQIIARPQYVAENTGIEQIAYLDRIAQPTASPSLADLWDLFVQKQLSVDWLTKCETAWKEFSSQVGVELVRELRPEHFGDFNEFVLANFNAAQGRHRLQAVRSIVRWPLRRGRWADDCGRVADYAKAFRLPKPSEADPQPIEPADFHALLTKADELMRAVLLVMLNLCMYPSEACALNRSEVSRKGGMFTFRNKTGKIRAGVLWPETATALDSLKQSSECEAIFQHSRGRFTKKGIEKRFSTLRTALELPHVQLNHIRDGAYTAAIERGAPEHIAKLLAGHGTDISNRYVKRRPQIVAAACDAIHRHYFDDVAISQ